MNGGDDFALGHCFAAADNTAIGRVLADERVLFLDGQLAEIRRGLTVRVVALAFFELEARVCQQIADILSDGR
ncbi:hypothetical protein SDC9_152925 [bioreactor metagenome]|uniref:Uncharacterized protein n=1 Tax=bioreactor metagenome TaxID=1076179 RepID=A0A645EZ51_9ZZZZ